MPMRNISNTSDLNKQLRGLAEDVVPPVAESLALVGQRYVQENVYDAYKGTPGRMMYQRTYQLKKNLVNLGRVPSGGSEIHYAVGYNLSDFRYNSVVNGYTADGALIPSLVEKGDTGAIYRKGKWHNQKYYDPKRHTFAQPRPFFQTFRKDVGDKLFIEQFDKELAKRNVAYKKGG